MKFKFNKRNYVILVLILFISLLSLSMVAAVAVDSALNSTDSVGDGDFDEGNICADNDDNNFNYDNADLDSDLNSLNDGNLSNDDNSNLTVVYFNASASSEGNGTRDNPYKNFNVSYLNYSGCIAYFANGEYYLDSVLSQRSSNYTFIGESMGNTVINYNGTAFTVKSGYFMNFVNLTLNGIRIINKGTLNCSNVQFINSIAPVEDSRNHSFGGAIKSYGSLSELYLYGCHFVNNTARYGGAVYIYNNGYASVIGSKFINNVAVKYGGAITLNNSSLYLYGSLFDGDESLNDSGGGIYIYESNVTIVNSNFTDCYSNFGGAVCQLSSNSIINNSQFRYNKAKYQGGSFYLMYGNISMYNDTFINSSSLNGGALFLDNSSFILIDESMFLNNSASYYGGAIFSNANLNVEINAKFYNNLAYADDDLHNQSNFDYTVVYDNNYTVFYSNITLYNSTLPISYNLADYGYVSSIKDQLSGGNCWAFATLSALESAILKAGYEEYDFSENNMKNLFEWYSDYGWNLPTNDGGYKKMGINYLISWLGPIYESDDLYDDLGVLSTLLSPVTHIQNVLFVYRENATDNEDIKNAILNYGALFSFLHWESGSYNYNTHAYYYNGSSLADHAITIVGWDDNYSASNFKTTPPGDGAFIIKNNWNDSWGENGYGYVSYYDSIFALSSSEAAYAFILNDSLKYTKNYQYDIIGLTDYLITGENVMWYANVYNATDDEILTAFSTYFKNTTNYTAYIYVNDSLVLTQDGNSISGYYTIKLNKYIPLNKGDSFKIVLKIKSDNLANIPISENASAIRDTFKENVSFFSYDGETWFDLYSYSGTYPGHVYKKGQVACLKAFTIDKFNTVISVDIDSGNSSDFSVSNSVNLNIIIRNESGQIASTNGSVEIISDNFTYLVKLTNGQASANIKFNDSNIHVLAFHYLGDAYYNESYLNKLSTHGILLNNLTNDKANNLTFNVYDINNNLVKSGNVVLIVNGSNFYNKKIFDLANSSANFIFSNLDLGVYDVVANYTGSDGYYSTVVYDSFEVKRITNITLNILDIVVGDVLTVEINLSKNITGNVSLTVNKKNYDVSTVNGYGVLNIPNNNLTVGKYYVTAYFAGTDEYYSSNASNYFRVYSSGNVIVKHTGNDTRDLQEAIDNANPGDTIILGKNYDYKNVDCVNITKNLTIIAEENVTISSKENSTCIFYIKSIADGNYSVENVTVSNIEFIVNNGTTVFLTKSAYYGGIYSNISNINITNNNFTLSNKGVSPYSVTVLRVETNSSTFNPNNKISVTNNTFIAGMKPFVLWNTDWGNEFGDVYIPTSKIQSYLTIDLVETYYADVVILLKDISGNVLSNKTIIYTLKNNNKTISKSAVTDNGGKVIISNLTGKYNINALFNGDSNYLASNVSINFTSNNVTNLSKKSTKLVFKNMTTSVVLNNARNGKWFNVNLTDSNGNYLSNKTILIGFNGKIYTRLTGVNGNVSLQINIGYQSANTFSISFLGDEEYNGTVGVALIVVNTLSTKITVSKYTYKSSAKTKTIKATLKLSNGTLLSGKKITFKVNGIYYTATTNSKGVASIKVSLSTKKTYTYTASFAGDNQYSSTSSSSKIVIK